MAQSFTFPFSGGFGDCCIDNINSLLIGIWAPAFFKFNQITLSEDFHHIIVKIDDDKTSKKEVQQYIEKCLAGTNYKLCDEEPGKYWLRGFLGLGFGLLVLLLSCLGSCVLLLKIALALFSLSTTFFLGIQSFRESVVEIQRKALGMDSLFMLSTGTALTISCLAFFIPTLPMMFETGLFIFGFRHLGTALKMSVYKNSSETINYERLIQNIKFNRRKQDKSEQVSFEQLVPGDEIVLTENSLVPLDGWLIEKTPVYMDVSRKEGTFIPKKLAPNAPVFAGMVCKNATTMQIGLGYALKFFARQPTLDCPPGEIWVYPFEQLSPYNVSTEINDHYLELSEGFRHIQKLSHYVQYDSYLRGAKNICIQAYSDRDAQSVRFSLDRNLLMNHEGYDFSTEIFDQLELATDDEHYQHKVVHLTELAHQQLSRAIVKYASEYGLTQTKSYLRDINKELTKPVIQAKPSALFSRFFVPTIISIALISGIIIGLLYSPLTAVRCMIAILVSACPCSLGFIKPLVMHLAKEKAEKLDIILSHSDVLSAYEQVNVIATDLNGTATVGVPEIRIQYASSDTELQNNINDIKVKLALIEHHSTHYIGKAIYEKIKGNQVLKDQFLLKPESVTAYQGGVAATIEGATYLLGNINLLKQFGVTPKVTNPGMIYFMVEKENTYVELATIKMQDELRGGTQRVLHALHQRGYKIRVITGADEPTASSYIKKECPFVDIYPNCPPIDEYKEGRLIKGKGTWIEEWQMRGERVLMVGDGMNDIHAFKAAHATLIIDHPASDEGLRYQAQARMMHNQFSGVMHVLDLAHHSMWTLKLNLFFSLAYNVLTVLLTNMLLLACGIILHPGFCAALMAIQLVVIIGIAYQQIQPTSKTPVQAMKRHGLFGSLLNGISSLLNDAPGLNVSPEFEPHPHF